jgi:hypothetical protein
MESVKKFYTTVCDKSASPDAAPVDDPRTLQEKAGDKEAGYPTVNDAPSNEQEKPAEDAQAGVKKIEAVTIAWGKHSAYLLLVL